ncbi:ogr/Delta-like zinc finger family protein [Kushneria phosphatilytica]|nr:ogr/Delta-like zinc finger family protein [Kushneria phosphatilytica]
MERRNNMRLSCPHCGEFARIRKSQQLTPVYREATVECQNPDCGWRGKMALEMTQTLTFSQQPNPEIRLPMSPRLRDSIRDQLMVQ